MSDLQIKDNFFVEVRINMFYISMKGGGGGAVPQGHNESNFRGSESAVQ